MIENQVEETEELFHVLHIFIQQDVQWIWTGFLERFSQFWLGFTMVIYEKIHLETYISNQYIWFKYTTQLYFILGGSWAMF